MPIGDIIFRLRTLLQFVNLYLKVQKEEKLFKMPVKFLIYPITKKIFQLKTQKMQ